MKTAAFSFLFTMLFVAAAAQPNNRLNQVQVQILKPLQLAYANAMDLLNPQVIPNALQLVINSGQAATSVFAQVSFTEPVAGLNHLLALRLSSKTVGNAIFNTATVPLSQTPALLFMQPRELSEGVAHAYIYDVVLNPTTTMIAPGQYNFAINFTITAQ